MRRQTRCVGHEAGFGNDPSELQAKSTSIRERSSSLGQTSIGREEMIAAVHPIKRSAQGRSSTMLPRLVFGRGWFKLIDWQYRPTRSLRWSAFLWVLGGSSQITG